LFVRNAAVLGASVPLGVWGLSACGVSTSSASAHRSPENLLGLTPDQALQKLKEGNERFVAVNGHLNVSSERRVSVASGQHPFAGIIGCIDSRVPPELVFDRGLGDLFVGRVGAAIADDSQIGGMEFGVLEFGMPLLVVLGHEKCGAVTATIEDMERGDTNPPGEIGSVVGPIIPAVQAAEAKGAVRSDLVEQSVRESLKISVAALRKSPVLSGLISAGKLKVVGARYDLDTGRVAFLY
jgi:carbonic anhydrase